MHSVGSLELNTDEFSGCKDLGDCGFRHVTVNHKAGEYARPCGAGVDPIEGFRAQLKRGINGTHTSRPLWDMSQHVQKPEQVGVLVPKG